MLIRRCRRGCPALRRVKVWLPLCCLLACRLFEQLQLLLLLKSTQPRQRRRWDVRTPETICGGGWGQRRLASKERAPLPPMHQSTLSSHRLALALRGEMAGLSTAGRPAPTCVCPLPAGADAMQLAPAVRV